MAVGYQSYCWQLQVRSPTPWHAPASLGGGKKASKSPSSSSQPPTFSDAASSDFRLLVTFLSSSSRSPHFLPKDKRRFLVSYLFVQTAVSLKEVFKRRNPHCQGPPEGMWGKMLMAFTETWCCVLVKTPSCQAKARQAEECLGGL